MQGLSHFPALALPVRMRRRDFIGVAPLRWLAAAAVPACTSSASSGRYAALAAEIRRVDVVERPVTALPLPELARELVRYATLAPSSHNTQCWKFAVRGQVITILPDHTRRCPAVDPDDHHVFVTLGCAAENLALAALAHGWHAQCDFDAQQDTIHVTLLPTPARVTPWFQAIPARQCTRAAYDGQALTSTELQLLEQAGTSSGVQVLLLTERLVMERVLEVVLQGNSAQLDDPAFMAELQSWIRFNAHDALRTRDGLFSVVSGSPAIPSWLGQWAFSWLLTAKRENDKIAHQVRHAAGLAVFVASTADHAHWVEVGQAYERFALQATVLGVRNAFLNQAVEVPAQRARLASVLGLEGLRPDLVVRFGRGPAMPPSLRRAVDGVMV